MKAIICLLGIIAVAHAGFLLGGLGLGLGGIGGGGGGVNGGGWSSGGVGSGWSSGGYGGGWASGGGISVPQTKIIKVIEAPSPVVQPLPIQIVKVIHDVQPVVAPALKIIKVIEKPSLGYGW